jgi:hypothetical protein
MTKEQESLCRALKVNAHIARAMGISQQQLKDKKRSIELDNTPIIRRDKKPPLLFEPLFFDAQFKFWNDLIEIATENLKELEIKNGNS